jgi:cellulose synthase/poly-beta-1,6-N-acetylglucosamine synthase-like glycosyltransferase
MLDTVAIPIALSILFGLLLVACAYTYIGFYLVLKAWARLSGSPPPSREPHTPSVSLFISAYNEAAVIEKKLRNACQLEYPPDALEICLVSDGSTDGTEAAGDSCQGDSRVRVFHCPERRGKNAALNEAIPQTTGDILVFSDANTLYQSDAISELVLPFSDANVGCVVGGLNFVSDAGEQVDGGLYWRHENRLKALQSALGSVLVANGSIFAVRRSLFRPLENDVANDFQTPMEAGAQGFKILYEPKAVAVEKSATDHSEEFARKVRIITRGLTGTAKCWRLMKGRRLFFFLSHKFLRWFIGYVQVALLLVNVPLVPWHWIFAMSLGLQCALYALALLGWAWRIKGDAPKLFDVPFYLCMVNAAGVVASWRFLRGKRFSVWEKAETAR